ncbi:hypothetical protein MC885_001233 [Smutsia gigantea]|nr:hypothetical protein MC885_001233 [Smutsia gigantea]
MKLEASDGVATSEVPKPEKEAELRGHFQTQEPGATSSPAQGLRLSRYHSWLPDPDRSTVLAKRKGGMVRAREQGPAEKG